MLQISSHFPGANVNEISGRQQHCVVLCDLPLHQLVGNVSKSSCGYARALPEASARLNVLSRTDKSAVTAGGVTLVFFGGTCTTIWTVEHLGRKAVMLWGAILCSKFMILFTIGLAVDTHSSQLLAVVSIFLFEFFFGASWCPLPWVYVPEIAPLHVRHIGTSMGVFTQWFVTFIVSS